MARVLMAATLSLALAGCYHAQRSSSQRAVATWRAMQAPRGGEMSDGTATPDEPAPGEVLTAEQTYALALANSPDLAVLAAQAEVAEANVRAARQIDNPQLRLTNFNIDEAIAAQPGMNIGLRVPIPRPGTVRAKVERAELGVESQQGANEEARRLLRAHVYKLFARLAMLQADREQVLRAAELRAAKRDQVAARVQQAVATRLDAALAEVAHAEARDEGARIDSQVAQIHAELARLAGATGPLRFKVDPAELQARDLDLDVDALTERAMASRPELRAAQARVDQAHADVYLARSKAWPWFDWAQIQYRAGPTSTAASFGFGVALTLPIFSWNRGEIKATRALARQRELEERAEVAAVAREVAEVVERVERTARRVHDLEQGLLPRLDVAVREAEAALAAGSLDAVTASEVAARMVSARRLHIAALLEHREAVLDLEAAIGGPVSASRP